MKVNKYAILFSMTFTQFVVPYMLSAVGVSLPVIGREFQAGATVLTLVETAFIGCTGMFMLPFGRLSDMYGREPFFLAGLSLFTLSTFLMPLSPNMAFLIGIRMLQGFGGAMQVSTGLAIISEAFPPGERGRAYGIASAGVYLGISVGPTLGGLLTTHWGWRWIFYSGAPFCLLTLLLSFRTLPLSRIRKSKEVFDWGGTLLNMLCIGSGVIGGAFFDHLFGKIAFGSSLFFLAGFIFWESRAPFPLVSLRLFRENKDFSYGCAVQFINYSATFGVTFLFSLYLQYVHGLSAFHAGMILVVQPVIQAILSPYFGRMSDKVAPDRLACAGMALATVGLGVSLAIGMTSTTSLVLTILVLLGFGASMFAAPNMSIIMGSVEPEQYGVASAMTGAMRTVGMIASMTFIALILSFFVGAEVITVENSSSYMQAMSIALVGLLVFSLFGTALSFKGITGVSVLQRK